MSKDSMNKAHGCVYFYVELKDIMMKFMNVYDAKKYVM